MLPGITLESVSLTWVSPGRVDWLLGLDREGRRADVIRPISVRSSLECNTSESSHSSSPDYYYFFLSM